METIDRQKAVDEVRLMASQFASLYFDFVSELYHTYGREQALKLTQKILFNRARQRAEKMIARAEKLGLARVPENITKTSDVAYLGWDSSLGRDHCPYGAMWNEEIGENPWFREFACLYCDVTDTTIAEVFTGAYSHKLTHNVVLGHDACLREYFEDEQVKNGRYTYEPKGPDR